MVIQKKIAQLRRLRKINDALLVKREQMHINEFLTGLKLAFLSTGHKDLDPVALMFRVQMLHFQSLIIQQLKMSGYIM